MNPTTSIVIPEQKVIRFTYEDGTVHDRSYEIDLGGGHLLSWTFVSARYEYVAYGDTTAEAKKYHRQVGDETICVGMIINHRSRTSPSGWCAAGGRFRLSPYEEDHKTEIALPTLWTFDGSFDAPTFAPSFLCACRECHMFIRGGQWVDAGCAHPRA